MNEKILQQVGSEAEEHYANHRLSTFNKLMAEQRAKEEIREGGPVGLRARITPTERRQIDRLSVIEWGMRREADLKAAEFAKENAEELHDLAALEARLAGVAINVEQPLSVGEKNETHTSE
ncbi:MAG TPA: hypothetical protein VGE34_04670 [Candidatus Saccharimonadales bacterium]